MTSEEVNGGESVVQSFKILVVDDFGGFRQFVCSLLQPRAEFQVKQASDGLEAVQKAEEIQPDVILLDISLPKLNGIEVARRVHKLVPDAKILFLSVESDADLVREALNVGAGYIHKPGALRDLLPAIETVLKGEQFVNRPAIALNSTTRTPFSKAALRDLSVSRRCGSTIRTP